MKDIQRSLDRLDELQVRSSHVLPTFLLTFCLLSPSYFAHMDVRSAGSFLLAFW